MKKKHLLFLAGFAVIITAGLFPTFNSKESKKYTPRIEKSTSFVKGYRGGQEFFQNRRSDINGIIDVTAMRKGIAEVANKSQLKSTNSSEIVWDELGPDNIGGRVRALLYDRNNPNILYAGGISGGLWRSTTAGLSWNKVIYSGDALTNGVTNLNVSCITQASNGDIYFGTGEYTGSVTNYVGTNGHGIWKSTDGLNFTLLPQTYTTSNQMDIFQSTQRLAADPTNPDRIYAATFKGLRITTNGGQTWEDIPTGISLTDQYKVCRDVKVGSEGTVIASINDKTYISTDGGMTFSSSVTWPKVPNGRLEFAIAPSNPDYMYCQAANPDGTLENIYQSTDRGLTWSVIGPGGYSTFQPLGNQGTYDNTIAVFPHDPEKIIIGGQRNVHTWSPGTEWILVANSYFVHADHHEIIFHPDHKSPTNPNGNETLLIGTDGGIFISEYDGVYFTNRNKNFNVTQFYAIGFDGEGHVIGGTQDNGTLYNDFGGNTIRNFTKTLGGDGGASELSKLDPRVSFATIYFGYLKRSQEKDTHMDETGGFFFNNKMLFKYWGAVGSEGESNIGSLSHPSGPFVTQFKLWESYYDENSIDSVYYTNDTLRISMDEYNVYYAGLEAQYTNFNVDTTHYTNANGETSVIVALTISAGETVYGESQIYSRPLPYVLTSSLYPGDHIKIKDTYQAMLAMPLYKYNTGEWDILLTRKPLNFDVLAPDQPWSFVLPAPHAGSNWSFRDLEFSHDGEYLFYAIEGTLYRISNLLNSRTQDQLDNSGTDYNLTVESIYSFNGRINDIAIDATNPDNVFISLSGYGADNVYYSTNATSPSVNFLGKAGSGETKLPGIPVFTGIINSLNGDQVMVGTEFGIYTTDDITAINPEWIDQSAGIGHVITLDIRQQVFENTWGHDIYNHGVVYVGTHGRGIFKSDSWKGPEAIEEPETTIASAVSTLKLYPNPVNTIATLDFSLYRASDIMIEVYDLQGKLVIQKNAGKHYSGNHKLNFDFSELEPGTYIVSLISNYKKSSAKVVVY